MYINLLFKWCLKENSNFGCIFVGSIGDDEYGIKIKEELEKQNIIPLLEVKEKIPTSKCGVAIYEGERCLIPVAAASTRLTLEFIKKQL